MKVIMWWKLSSDESYEVMKVIKWWKLSSDENYQVMKIINRWKSSFREYDPTKYSDSISSKNFLINSIADLFKCIFSITRRSRSDVSDWVTESVSVSTDLTDVTLVSEDTY